MYCESSVSLVGPRNRKLLLPFRALGVRKRDRLICGSKLLQGRICPLLSPQPAIDRERHGCAGGDFKEEVETSDGTTISKIPFCVLTSCGRCPMKIAWHEMVRRPFSDIPHYEKSLYQIFKKNLNQVLDHNILLQARRTRLGGTDPCQFCFDHLHLCLLHPFHSHSKQRYTHAYRHTSIHPTACTIDFDITNII